MPGTVLVAEGTDTKPCPLGIYILWGSRGGEAEDGHNKTVECMGK